jgi:hypothetical protein
MNTKMKFFKKNEKYELRQVHKNDVIKKTILLMPKPKK